MRMRFCKPLFLLLLAGTLALPAFAQQPKFPFNLDPLQAGCEKRLYNCVSVTMDKSVIDFALSWLPKKDPQTAKIRDVVQGLTGIYVRSFEFEKEGEYQMSMVDDLRKQLIGPGWSKIVETRGKDENVDVSLHLEGDKILGITVISAEPKELTVVSINGTIRPEQLSDLEGFGVPHISGMTKPASKVKVEVETPKGAKKNEAPVSPKKEQ
jgi:hypothetical protein